MNNLYLFERLQANRTMWWYLGILLVVLVGSLLDQSLFTISALFFAGPCNDGCASDDASCSSGGSGSDGGGSGGDTGSCGCDSVGCAPGECTSGCSDSGSSATSTPYLYIKKRGEYEMQNDVMIGYPTTAVATRERGEEKYRMKMLGNDVYPIMRDGLDLDAAGRANFQLREIEAEESYIYRLRMHAYKVPAQHRVLQSWDHFKLISYDPNNRAPLQSKVVLNDTIDCSHKLQSDPQKTVDQERDTSLRLYTGDVLSFNVSREQGNHLVISAFWRDWGVSDLADDIHGLQKSVKSPFSFTESLVKNVRKTAAKMVMFLTILAGSFYGSSHTQRGDDDSRDKDELLAFIKKANLAHADMVSSPTCGGDGDRGKSLHVSYRHPEHGEWVFVATVQPRAYMPHEVYVLLQDMAYNEEGVAQVKIEATKGHYVKSIAVLNSSTTSELVPVETSALEASHLRDQTILGEFSTNSEADQKNPIHLIAGDVLDLKTAPLPEDVNYVAVDVLGYYTPLSEGSEKLVSGWEDRIGTREKALIESIYGA